MAKYYEEDDGRIRCDSCGYYNLPWHSCNCQRNLNQAEAQKRSILNGEKRNG